jgi:hypothetical protein
MKMDFVHISLVIFASLKFSRSPENRFMNMDNAVKYVC